MSITSSRANVTRTINLLKELNKTADEMLTRCSKATPEELKERIQPLVTTRDMIISKSERLQTYMAALDEAVDKQHDNLEEADLKKHDEYAELQSEIADLSDTAVVRLNVWIKKAKELEESAKRTPLPNTDGSTVTVAATPIHSEATGIKLLPLPKLPTFSGNVWDFENFMAIFNEVVEKSGQTDFMKFNHLTNALKGEPKELLEKFKLKEENYRKALQALQSKYGSKERSIIELSKKLESEQAESNSTPDQRKILDQMSIVIGQLKEMDEAVNTRLMKSLVIKKFARRIQEKIFNKKIELNDESSWTIEKILADAEAIIAKEEAMSELLPRNDDPKKKSGNKSDKSEKSEKQEKTRDGKKHPPNSSKKKTDPHCVFCKEDGHWGHKCSKSVQERWKVVHEEKLCHTCLRSGHTATDCKYRRKPTLQRKPTRSRPRLQYKLQSRQTQIVARRNAELQSKEMTQWSRRKAKLSCRRSRHSIQQNFAKFEWGPISIMIDTGSDLSFITKSLHEGWKLPNKGEQVIHTRTFNSEKASSTAFTRTAIQIKTPDKILELDVNVSDNLAGRIRKAPVTKEDLATILTKNFSINAGSLDTTTCPEMIIGCDHLYEILTGEIGTLPSGLNTLGTVWGAATMGRPQFKTAVFQTGKVSDEEENLLFMSIEEVPEDPGREVEEEQMRDTKMKEPQEFAGPLIQEQSVADKETVEFFEKTVEKREDGYYVRLPLKENHPELPDNFPMSLGRLRQIHQKYSNSVLQSIEDVFQEQEGRGYIEKVELVTDHPGKYRYNPIQAVITPHKTTTKCRVVVDGSSRTKNSVSLNDIIKKGPVILPDMVDMLIRFRAGKTVIVSDVEKAFLQVFLHEDDRDLTRVLWLKDYTKPPTRDNLVCYRFTRVLFGLNVSPFLLAAVIHYHLRSVDNQILAKQLPYSLYVDNLILTTDASTEEAHNTYRQVKGIFSDMHMNIREFLSNSPHLNEMIEEKDRASSQSMKVLGIPWDSLSDKVSIAATIELSDKETRSTISGAIASNFDPLGLMVPLLLPAKLYQRDNLWNSKYDWKTTISPEDQAKWAQVAENINGFTRELPRNVVDKTGTNKLITFCDASKDAAAFCIYAHDGSKTHIVFGKSKIWPLKEPWTIPKLETHALMMGTTKTLGIYKALKVDNIAVDEVIILTDSSIALDWLKSIPLKKNTGVLVTRRLESIRLATSELEDEGIQVQFGHVRSEQNPADLGTRGCDKTTFDNCMWWKGPDFIQGEVSKWSQELSLFQLPQISTMCVRVEEVPTETIFNCEATNNYRKMCRIVAYAVRFLNIKFRKLSEESRKTLETKFPAIKAAESSSIIWAEELKSAETLLLRDQQKAISKDQLKKVQNLGIVENAKGLLVCKGRLENSDLEDSAKNPILIMPNTRISKQIIDDCHKPFHSSVDQTIDTVRRKFWIPRLRRATQRYVKTCVQCQKFSKQPVKYPNMGPLPEHRVKRSRPFANTGLDNFGPIPYVKEDGTEGTAMGTIFTCSCTRLLHIELAKDASALEFLNALRRFVAIRGLPELIVSDNGTNFVLSQKIIEEAFKIYDPTKQLHDIKWKFNTPLSPWKGGFYERMVKSVKGPLYKAMGRKKLTYEELKTILYEIMSAVNSRPLTYPEQDINSKQPIRPQDFVNQEMTTVLPLEAALEIKDDYLPSQEGQANETKLNTIKAFESSVKKTNEVWSDFQQRYLAQLREHHKVRMVNKRGSPALPKEGQIVLICDENQPRNSWKMGRVTTLNQSKDGIIRDVELINSNGRTIKRSINMIVPLEMDIEDDPKAKPEPNPTPESPKPPEETSKGRYNLRKRKDINYDEDTDANINVITTSLSSLLPTKASSTLFLTLLALMCLTGVTAEKPDVLCNQHGLQLYGQYRNFEACAENYCTSSTRWSWKAGEGQQVWIPPALKIHKHHVTVKVDDGKELHIIEKDCAAVPFCETIDCTLCWSNIVNPECHIIWAIIGSSILFFFSMLLIHALCYTPIQMKEVVKLCGRAISTVFYCCIGTCRRINPFRRSRISRWRTTITAMSILIMTTQACQEIDMISQLETSCDQDGNCRFYTEETLHLNQAQREGCLRLEKNGTTVKDIRITLVEVELHCQKQTIAFTQEIETRVWSTKRCAHMGSFFFLLQLLQNSD
ncbi:hypothetical protein CAEBREN_31877 [Caenorhabditis brenneri]|uniref:Integrase catalytic domain-containing protein n=1 Tax=Caenorhabditis brenneri TaxID=135651 RepID=G0N6A8_CAEBE|nr:hypothetical protein CAEBREN_31877 [Caenorhabditis brenneri]